MENGCNNCKHYLRKEWSGKDGLETPRKCGMGHNSAFQQWWDENSHRTLEECSDMACFEETDSRKSLNKINELLDKLTVIVDNHINKKTMEWNHENRIKTYEKIGEIADSCFNRKRQQRKIKLETLREILSGEFLEYESPRGMAAGVKAAYNYFQNDGEEDKAHRIAMSFVNKDGKHAWNL